MRCSLHGISYPPHVDTCLVPGCTEELDFLDGKRDTPDEDWRGSVEYHTAQAIGLRYENPPGDAVTWGELPDVAVTPAIYQSWLWIAHAALTKAGYRHLEDFSVVKIQGKFYELQAHIGRATLTHGIEEGAWWIEEINPATYTVPEFIPEEVTLHGEEEDAV